ncbi:ATP-dependent zinc metalloprotease, FtsH family [Skeletonema marinoi]|uniref:ATP-dependent zinc metalloprotease, FtsH family n=1 Tax=Skeletonema marinoi TaxID=267567 RepID=A0AAD8Y3N5_9STRA|nr:ATP-dependent zinc metalloprotease, FtsH family [Skeletonema marinoi]
MVRCRAATSLMSLISLVTLTLLPLDNIAALQITSPLFVPHSNHGRPAVVPLTTNRYGPGVACNGSIRCHQRSHAIENSRIRYNIAPLFSSANGSSQEEEGKSPKRRQPVQTIKGIIMKILRFFTTAPAKFMAYYRRLTKKGKIILAMQLMTLGLLMGAAAKTTATAKANQANRPVEVSYSTFLDLVDVNGKGHKAGKHPALKLDNVIISKDRVGFRVVTDKEKHELALIDKKLVQKEDVSVIAPAESTRTIYAMKPMASQELIETLREHEVPFRAASTKGANTAANVARFSIFLVYLLFLSRMYKAMGGGGGTGGGSGAPGKLATFTPGEALVKFDDIEGIDEAKFEVMELVDTLRNPKKYEILGARAPTGLLLEGPPGTGKTMLARATAATAGVPLLYCSGSDFVEMFVGRGAARVRNTFARAAKMSPCIIFIDELDALGKSRDMGGMGASMRSNDEAEQTLNQLLACMDGLDSSRKVCVLAATNRREVLDPALIRPGRFDRIIKVTLPDTSGRERILRVHAQKLPGFSECNGVEEKRPGSLGKRSSVDLSAVAAVTKGLCGADLEFIVNEAAIRAVRRVSAKLRAGEDPKGITPVVSAEDFEKSVSDFKRTRQGGSVNDILNNVLGKRD